MCLLVLMGAGNGFCIIFFKDSAIRLQIFCLKKKLMDQFFYLGTISLSASWCGKKRLKERTPSTDSLNAFLLF